MKVRADLPTVRAVNYARREHLPTYIAIRHLTGSFKSEGECYGWVNQFALRRATTSRPLRYLETCAFKGVSEESREIEYRQTYAPSPTALLTESWLLSQYAVNEKRRPTVYSYRWPLESSGQLYEHFINGWSERNKHIGEALIANPGFVVWICDVQKFYHKINKDDVKNSMASYNKVVFRDEELIKAADYIVDCCLGTSKSGIPVGPPLAHHMANEILKRFDSLMQQKYPGRYFRYVDDVAVICPEGDIGVIERLVEGELEKLGLSLNKRKCCVVPGDIWLARQEITENRRDSDVAFSILLESIAIYLQNNSNEIDKLRGMFSDNGFMLPIEKLRALSQYSFFWRFLAKVGRAFKFGKVPKAGKYREIYQRYFGAMSYQARDLLDIAKHCRSIFLDRAMELSSLSVPEGNMERRWYVQDCRFAFSKLLYLLPFEQYRSVEKLIPDMTELTELRVLIHGLVNLELKNIIEIPGAACRTFGELAREKGLRFKLGPEAVIGAASIQAREALGSLSVYGVLDIDAQHLERFSMQDAAYLRFCLAKSEQKRIFEDFDYIDEIQCLNLKKDRKDFDVAIATRMGEGEEILLEGSLLDGCSYR